MIKLLKSCTYLTKDYDFKIGDLLIEDGIIINISSDLNKSKYEIDKIIDCSNFLVISGFVNGHTHNPSMLFRGLFKDKALSEWFAKDSQGRLQEKGFKYLDEKINEKDFKVLMLKAYAEYLKQGITTLVETGQSDIENVIPWTVQALKTSNLRGVIDVYDKIESYYQKSDEYVKYCTHLPEEENITNSILPQFQKRKDRIPSLRMTHCLETNNRKNIVYDKYLKSTVELFDEFNLLDKNTLLFHCTQVDKKDIEIIADRNASIVYCPVSNYWSGGGNAPIEKFIEFGINIMLGTDFLLSDLREVMRNSYYALKINSRLDKYKAEDIFKMVTINAHKILAPEMKIGLIDIDYKADLQFIDKNDSRLWPLIKTNDYTNMLNNILLHSRSDMVKHVMIDGNWVIKNNEILVFDEEIIDEKYKKILNRIYDGLQ
ncbi:MAG: amidohydrolase family protein [Halanaerobiales bacterium]|nr:amidohydrolase family protein [Halanaerobiales bacterium]